MSTAKHEVIPVQKTEVATTPTRLIEIALANNADIDKLTKLMDLQERYEANEAKKSYVAAMALFKSDPPIIFKDKENKQYKSMYTSLGNFVNTVNPALSKYGLSAKWEIDQTNGIKVTCVMTHIKGHSESVSLAGPPDDSGSKNKLQQIKSTLTYLEIATFQAITGLVSSDASMDDDGNSAVTTITSQQAADLTALLDEVKADKQKFCAYFKIDKVENLPAQAYTQAVALVEAKRK